MSAMVEGDDAFFSSGSHTTRRASTPSLGLATREDAARAAGKLASKLVASTAAAAKVGSGAAVTAAASASHAMRRPGGGGAALDGAPQTEYSSFDLADQADKADASASSYLEGMERWGGGDGATSVLSAVGGPWSGRGRGSSDPDAPVTQYQSALVDPTDNVGVVPSRASGLLSRMRRKSGGGPAKADRGKDASHQAKWMERVGNASQAEAST